PAEAARPTTAAGIPRVGRPPRLGIVAAPRPAVVSTGAAAVALWPAGTVGGLAPPLLCPVVVLAGPSHRHLLLERFPVPDAAATAAAVSAAAAFAVVAPLSPSGTVELPPGAVSPARRVAAVPLVVPL
ncbi:hypothetical protein THAOC_21162, partial [Thalassiosira oceanica]